MSKFRTKFQKREYVYDVIDPKEHELHDSLKPFSVSEQIARFTAAGLQLEATRRKELASIRAEVDDPEDFETTLDKEHLTPADIVAAQKEYAQKIHQRSIAQSVNETGKQPVGNSELSTAERAEPTKGEAAEVRG